MRWRALVVLSLLLVPSVGSAASGNADDHGYLVTLEHPWHPEHAQAISALGFEVVERYDVANTVLLAGPQQATALLEDLAFVTHVTPDHPIEPMLSSSRPASGLADALVRAGLTGSGVTVALLDGGIDQDHPALADRVVADIGFSDEGAQPDASSMSEHGTHVAGILVGTGDEDRDRGLEGMAPGAGLVSLDLSAQFTTSNALRAFEWIYDNHEEHNIKVVANSWGRQRAEASYDASDPIIRASDALVEKGIVVVFSSGNGGDQPGQMTLEATNPNVLTVGAATDRGQVEAYSSRGPILDGDQQADWVKPDLVAPGSRVISAWSGPGPGVYRMMNGTSMAAPHVAGAAALLLSLNPELTPGQVKGLLLESARDVGADGVDHESGHGMLDVRAAVALLDASDARTVERRQVVAQESGSLTGPGAIGDVLEVASKDATEELAFHVRENTTQLHVKVAWQGKAGLKATLHGPQGTELTKRVSGEHTFTVKAPASGDWLLELESQELGEGRYDTQAAVTWTETRPGTGLPVDQTMRPSSGGFPSMGVPSPFGPSIVPGVPNLVPILAGTAVTLLLLVGRGLRRKV